MNYHAITCLHVIAGEYRPCQVTVGTHLPPEHYRVQGLMDDFVNDVNRNWDKFQPVPLAAYVLWRLNWIHPFINGNARTARAASYFVLCVKAGGWLPGETILPELLSRERDRYVQALRAADGPGVAGQSPLAPLVGPIEELLAEQLAPFMTPPPAVAGEPAPAAPIALPAPDAA